MPNLSEIARTYFKAFEANDHAAILNLLTDDVVWHIHGQKTCHGKQEFEAEIVNEGFESGPELTIERIIEAGNTVTVPHVGETRTTDGALFRFASADILTFNSGNLITQVDSYVVPLTD